MAAAMGGPQRPPPQAAHDPDFRRAAGHLGGGDGPRRSVCRPQLE